MTRQTSFQFGTTQFILQDNIILRMYLFSTEDISIRSPYYYSQSLKPQIALQSIRLQVSKVHHISSSPMHQIIWVEQHLIIFVSGMVIVQYDALANKFKVLQRNYLEQEIIIFKGLDRQLSNTTLGYITKKEGGRYDFLYRNLNEWVLISTFKLMKDERIVDIIKLNFNCFGVVLEKSGGKKLLIFREDIEVEYEKEGDGLLFVFPAEKGSLLVVNRYQVEKIVFDTYMLGDVKVVSTIDIGLEGGVVWAEKVEDNILIVGANRILMLDKLLVAKQISIPTKIQAILKVKVMDNYIFLAQSNKVTRFLLQEIDIFGKQSVYKLLNPTHLAFQNVEDFVVSSNCNTLMIKRKQETKVALLNIESYKISNFVPEMFTNYISLEFQSQLPIDFIQQNPVRTPEIYYLKNSKIYQNDVEILDDSVICYSLSLNGLYLIAGFQYYLKAYYVGRKKLFLIESLPMLNIIDIKFYNGDKYLVLMKQQLRVYSGIPAQVTHIWSLLNSNKYLSLQVNKHGNQVIVHEASGSYTIYSLITFVKLQEIKIPKARFLMYDFSSKILMSYLESSGMEFYHMVLEKSVTLMYQDRSVPTHAVVVEHGGFIIVTTAQGSIRIHKWPPEKQFATNYLELKVFPNEISSLGFDDQNSTIYTGSRSGSLLTIKMIYQNSDSRYYRGIMTGLYLESRRLWMDSDIEVKKLEEDLEHSKAKYQEKIKAEKAREVQVFESDNLTPNNELEHRRKQVSSKLHQMKVLLHTLPQTHSEEIDKLRKQANDSEMRARQVGQNYKEVIQKLQQKHQQNMLALQQTLNNEQITKAAKPITRKVRHRYHRSQGLPVEVLPVKTVPLMEEVNKQLQLADQNLWKGISKNSLESLQRELCSELNYNSRLKSMHFHLYSQIDAVGERIFSLSELMEKMSTKLNVEALDQEEVKQMLAEKLQRIEEREHLNDKNNRVIACRKEAQRADETSKRLQNLEKQYYQVLKEESEEINRRYYQLFDQLREEFQRKTTFEKEIHDKRETLKKLKELMRRKLRKRIQTNYEIESFQTQILKARTNLNPGHRRRVDSGKSVKRSCDVETEFCANQSQLQRANLSRVVKNKKKAFQLKVKQNENLIFESHRLKKETTNSQIYLRHLKGGLTPSEIERIQSKQKYGNKELKLTPFQQYHREKKGARTYTCSSPISRKISQFKGFIQ